MLTLELKQSTPFGESQPIAIDFPSHVADISLRQYIAYERHVRQAPEWYRTGHNESGEPITSAQMAQWMRLEIEAIHHLTGISLDQLLSLDFSDMTPITFEQSAIDSVTALSAYLHRVVASYQPQLRASFEFKGETYYFPVKTVEKMTMATADAPLDFKRLTAQEYIDINNFNHYWGSQDTEKGDFQKVLGMLAVLCRKDGEALPLDEAEHDDFVAERIELFKDVPMDVGLDVWFFFVHTPRTYAATHSSLMRLSHLSSAPPLPVP